MQTTLTNVYVVFYKKVDVFCTKLTLFVLSFEQTKKKIDKLILIQNCLIYACLRHRYVTTFEWNNIALKEVVIVASSKVRVFCSQAIELLGLCYRRYLVQLFGAEQSQGSKQTSLSMKSI